MIGQLLGKGQKKASDAAVPGEMRITFSYIIRQALAILLMGIFLWQTFYSINKYLEGATSTTFQQMDPTSMYFPSLSFCPMQKILAEDETKIGEENRTFVEEVEMRGRADFLVAYDHLETEFAIIDVWDFPDQWSGAFSVNPFNLFIGECATYTAKDLVAPGYESVLSFYLHSDGIDHMIVFVNERNQTLLVPTSMYGRYFFKLPTLANSESGYIQYQIRVTERHSLPTEKLPCHEEDSKGDYSLLNCIEEYFEGNRSCSLPWRARPGGADKVCEAKEDLWAYKMYYSFLLQASEQAIYEATGCYHTCMYMKYETVEIVDETVPFRFDPYYNLMAIFFLAPGGVLLEREMLVYDFYDLVGNVGGFLGLFLGASILSMYDGVKNNMQRLKYIVK